MRVLFTAYVALVAIFITPFTAAWQAVTDTVNGQSYKGCCFGGAAVLAMARSGESPEFLDETL